MASPALRQYCYSLLKNSAKLISLQYADNLLPTFATDGPQGDRFLVIRWGITTPGMGPVKRVRLDCWAYNRQPDFKPIAEALLEIREKLEALSAVVMSPTESILAVIYEGDSDDLYDDGYRAHTRWTSHTITASGS